MLALMQFVADTDDWEGHMGWGGGWWMIVWSTLTMAILVAAAVWFSRSGSAPHAAPVTHPPADPLQGARSILAERYASGDLTSAEYHERLSNLSSTTT